MKRLIGLKILYMPNSIVLSKLSIALVLLLVVASCVRTGSNSEHPNSDTGYAKYETSEYSIQYPDKWRLDTSGYMGTDFSIFSKQTSIHDKFIENVSLVINDVSDIEMDIHTYMEEVKKQIKTIALDGLLIETEMLTVNGVACCKLVFKQQQRIYKLKLEQRYWLKNGKAFVLTLACKENEYKRYKKRGEQMMNSFKLK